MPEAEVGNRLEVGAGRQQLLGTRTLERDQPQLEGAVLDLDIPRSVLTKPRQVLLPIRGVDDHKEALAASIHDEVVDHPSLLVANEVVLRVPVPEGREIVGDQSLQELERRRAGQPESAHVGHIEQPRDLAHRQVLVANRGVLLRHLPPAEVDHPPTEGHMAAVERCAVQRYSPSAGPSRSAASAGSMNASSSSSCLSLASATTLATYRVRSTVHSSFSAISASVAGLRKSLWSRIS